MGDSVTPHVQMTGPRDFKYLAAGIDTLDMAYYVDWGPSIYGWQPQLEHLRSQAIMGETAIWRHPIIGEATVRASNKRNYRYMIQLPDMVIWIANTVKSDAYPNVYISPSAQSLWLTSPSGVIEAIACLIGELGGSINKAIVSRVDLACDFALPESLELDAVRHAIVSRARKRNQHMDMDALETFYVAARGAPLQARIYDKRKKMLADPSGGYMVAIWDGIAPAWRVEFQIKRAWLRNFEINTFEDLKAKLAGMWTYLTGEWLTLRTPGPGHTSRRPLWLWWEALQAVATDFGPLCELARGTEKFRSLHRYGTSRMWAVAWCRMPLVWIARRSWRLLKPCGMTCLITGATSAGKTSTSSGASRWVAPRIETGAMMSPSKSLNDSPYFAPKELAARWRCSRSSVDRIAQRAGLTRLCLGEGRNGIVRYVRAEVEAYESK